MRLVLATEALEGLGGSETYALTVADALQRLGHDVVLYSPRQGEAARRAYDLGVRVAAGTADLPDGLDAALVQDGAVAADLAAARGEVPQVFVAHSDVFDHQLPLQVPGLTQVIVALYDRVEERVRGLAEPVEIVRLRQPVDVTRFAPLRPLPQRPRVALALGNYVRGPRLDVLREACARNGIELQTAGVHAKDGPTASPELRYAAADIVFGKARVVVEAMACGRAVFVYDHNGADGWVTPERYDDMVADNFGGQQGPAVDHPDRLAEQIGGYQARMGLANRDLAVTHHSASRHAARLVEVVRRLAPRPVPRAPLDELARLVRLAARQDLRQFALQAEIERLSIVLADAADDRHALREAFAAAEKEALSQQDHARRLQAEVDALRAELAAQAEAPAPRRRGLRRRADQTAGGLVPPPGEPPVPFIVGVPRSGTTLLRMQLDAHPDLAIGPETGIAFPLNYLRSIDADARETGEAIISLGTFPDLRLTPDEVRTALSGLPSWSLASGIRTVFAMYAARQGKPRWGEKTPRHAAHATEIAALLPEAHIVHVIRDGRGVLASVRDLSFAPGDGSVEAVARDWETTIRDLRAHVAAGNVPHYREVRYEDMLMNTERVLRDLCGWLRLSFDPAMLRAHERARARFDDLAEAPDGRPQHSREARWSIHTMLAEPPDPSRDARWRTLLTPQDVGRFEAVAGDLLVELGYDLTAPISSGDR